MFQIELPSAASSDKVVAGLHCRMMDESFLTTEEVLSTSRSTFGRSTA